VFNQRTILSRIHKMKYKYDARKHVRCSAVLRCIAGCALLMFSSKQVFCWNVGYHLSSRTPTTETSRQFPFGLLLPRDEVDDRKRDTMMEEDGKENARASRHSFDCSKSKDNAVHYSRRAVADICWLSVLAFAALNPCASASALSSFSDIQYPSSAQQTLTTAIKSINSDPNAPSAADALASSLGTSLKAATKDKPQIMLNNGEQQPPDAAGYTPQTRVVVPEGTQLKKGGLVERQPILQGMVYILDTDDNKDSPRPSPVDNLVLLARVARPGENASDKTSNIVAGAKIPISRVRFPMSFSMYEENLLIPRDDWLSQYSTESNILIDARVCPAQESDGAEEDSKKRWCAADQSTYSGSGVARLISNLPGLETGSSIRAAAALPMQ
jgi:hypothetical protein